MALKFKLKSKDEIPAEFQSLYVERDGAFILDVDGVADKSKLDEFRTNNVALLKQLDDLKKKFEGIDPEKVREIENEKRKLEDAQALKTPTIGGGSCENLCSEFVACEFKECRFAVGFG